MYVQAQEVIHLGHCPRNYLVLKVTIVKALLELLCRTNPFQGTANSDLRQDRHAAHTYCTSNRSLSVSVSELFSFRRITNRFCVNGQPAKRVCRWNVQDTSGKDRQQECCPSFAEGLYQYSK